MSTPSSSLTTLRPELSPSFEEFSNALNAQGFIAPQVLRVKEVPVQSGRFGRVTIESLLADRETARASGGGYNRQSWQFDTDNFATAEQGAEDVIDDRDSNLYREYFDAEQKARDRVISVIARKLERDTAAAVFNTSTWSGAALTTSVGTKWTAAATATPITNVEAAVQKVYDNSGMWPNALIISRKVFRNLRLVKQVQDLIAASGAGDPTKPTDITPAMLAQVFDLPFIIVGGGTQNTANQAKDAVLSPIWSTDFAMVACVATSDDMREPCLGRIMHWGGDGSSPGITVETYRDETVRSDVVRARMEYQVKILYPEMGHLLSNIS